LQEQYLFAEAFEPSRGLEAIHGAPASVG
jgi:hypothetical protein